MAAYSAIRGERLVTTGVVMERDELVRGHQKVHQDGPLSQQSVDGKVQHHAHVFVDHVVTMHEE